MELGVNVASNRAVVHAPRHTLNLMGEWTFARTALGTWRALADYARNDGRMTPAERGVIERLGSAFGMSREAVAAQIAERTGGPAPLPLDDCYRMLGLAPSVSDDELTRAWRRLLTQHHPDKLQGQGADEAALKAADARTRELRAAYERIVAARAGTA